MSEPDFLKVLWFVAGGLISIATFVFNKVDHHEREAFGAAAIVFGLFIVAYVIARAVTYGPSQ